MILLAAVDVVRPTTTPALATAADLAAVTVVGAIAAMLGTAVLAERGRPVAAVTSIVDRSGAVLAVVAAVLRLAEQLLGGAAPGDALTSRRVVGQLAAAVLVALLPVVRSDRAGLRPVERRVATGTLGALVVLAVVVAGPRAGSPTAFLPGLAASILAVLVAVGVGGLVGRRWPQTGGGLRGATLLLVAAMAVGWPAAHRPVRHTDFTDQVDLGSGSSLHLTVAPAAAGSNEVHLYLFDADGELMPASGGTITVDDAAARPLTAVGVGHYLALGLAFGDGTSWDVTVQLDREDARPLTVTTEVTSDD